MTKLPKEIQIEINNTCNSKCSTCPLKEMKRRKEIMKFSLFKKIIDELKEKKFTGTISPFYVGEPFIVPKIMDYLRYIKRELPNVSVRLFTNASKLTPKIGSNIVKEKLIDELIVSFDGGTKKAYESVRIGLSFEEVKANVHNFIIERNRQGSKKPKVEISMVVTDGNKNTTDALKIEFKDADEVTFHKYFEASVPGTKKWVYNSPVKRSKLQIFMLKRNFCFSLSGLTILSNGIVAQCCADYEGKSQVGDAKKETIEQIWNGKRMISIKDNLKHRRFDRLPLCSNCDLIDQNPLSRQLTKNVKMLQKHPKLFRYMQRIYAKMGAKGTK